MTIFEIKQAHPNCWVVIAPVGCNIEVPADRNRILENVQDWNVLNTNANYDGAKALYDQYLSDGFDSVYLYDTTKLDNKEHAPESVAFLEYTSAFQSYYERGRFAVSFILKIIECDLDTLIESVRLKKPAQIKKCKKTIMDTVQERFVTQRKLLIAHLLLKIFDGDYIATQRAITKCLTLNPQEVNLTDAEKNKMFAALWSVISEGYSSRDFSEVLDIIAKGALDRACDDDDDLPFN